MYIYNKPQKTTLKRNTSYQGETLEKKINRIVNNKEPIKDGAPIIYTERKDGVRPEYNIKTDRWEEALTAMDMVNKDKLAQREKLWLQKLDKQERWICGEKIDISKSEKQYYNVLEHYRRVNKELGYGNGQISWDREQYENTRRKIMQETRIINANKRLRREVKHRTGLNRKAGLRPNIEMQKHTCV